jgi:ATP-dependent helicase HrpB
MLLSDSQFKADLTRVPRTVLTFVAGEVIVLEPRRIAARLAARRAAWEFGEEPGETVGY